MLDTVRKFARNRGLDERILVQIWDMAGEEIRDELCACAPVLRGLNTDEVDKLVMRAANDVMIGSVKTRAEQIFASKYNKSPSSTEVQSAVFQSFEAVAQAALYRRFTGRRKVFVNVSNKSMDVHALIPKQYSWNRHKNFETSL